MNFITNKKLKYLLIFIAVVMLITIILPELSFAQFKGYGVKLTGDNYEIGGLKDKDWNTFLGKYATLITGIAGATTLTLGGALMLAIGKLGASAGNPQARSQALTGLLWTGIAIALMGGGGIVLGFFYKLIS